MIKTKVLNMKTFPKTSILLLLFSIILSCQNSQKETPNLNSIIEVDTIKKPSISMEDVLNDSIPIWHLSRKEQLARFERRDRFKYYKGLKFVRSSSAIYTFRNRDTLILEMYPDILNYRIREGGRYIHKVEYLNEQKNIVREINLDDLNPFSDKKNLTIGFVSDEELERIDSSGLLKPTQHVLDIDNNCLPNGYSVASYRLYSFNVDEYLEGRFLGFETFLKVLNPKGEVTGEKKHYGNTVSWVSDDGRYLCIISNRDSIPDELEIFDMDMKKSILHQQAVENQYFMYFRTLKTGLLHLVNRVESGKHLIFFDLEKRLKFEKEISYKDGKSIFKNFSSYYEVLQNEPFDTIRY